MPIIKPEIMDIYDMMLAASPKINSTIQAKLIDAFGSAEAIFTASEHQLQQIGNLNQRGIDPIINRVAMAEAKHEMHYCAKHNIKAIAATDAEYPSLLREIHDPPHVLFAMGDTSILNHNLISIVGTRNITSYGERSCMKIIENLAARIDNLVIVSGLAHGVDGAAHRAALYCGVPTIAIVPTHLPNVLPAANYHLARSIVEAGGTILSEMRSTMKSFKSSFIPRNRIIAGISAATLIIEAAESGGTISTANNAAAENRLVGAVPGRITDEMSRGCNRLIAQKIAIPITSGDDLIRALGWEERCHKNQEENAAEMSEAESAIVNSLTPEQRGVLACFRFDEALHISQLSELTQMESGELMGLLTELEIYGAVRALAGYSYERLVKIKI